MENRNGRRRCSVVVCYHEGILGRCGLYGECCDLRILGFVFFILILLKYIVGLGLLAIPYSFIKGGLVLGCLVMFLVTLISYITAQWILEV